MSVMRNVGAICVPKMGALVLIGKKGKAKVFPML